MSAEQLALSGLGECLIPLGSEQYTPELWKPLDPQRDVAGSMLKTCRREPTNFKAIISPYRESSFIVQTDTPPIAVVIGGALVLLRVADCLGVVISSTDVDGIPLITSFHRSLKRGYSMDDIQSAFYPHKGASKISFAIVGADLDPTTLALPGTPILEKDIAFYQNMARTTISTDITFGNCTCLLGSTKESQRTRGMFTTTDVFLDTNQPHRILTHQMTLNANKIIARLQRT